MQYASFGNLRLCLRSELNGDKSFPTTFTENKRRVVLQGKSEYDYHKQKGKLVLDKGKQMNESRVARKD